MFGHLRNQANKFWDEAVGDQELADCWLVESVRFRARFVV